MTDSTPSIDTQELVNYCDRYLGVARFRDYAPNGLQVMGPERVAHLVTGTTASLALIEAAIDQHADALLVHHGYFWKGEPEPLIGLKGKRIQRLMQHGIALIAYHLPLDAHPEVGNNAQLARLLNWTITGPLDPTDHQPIGSVGTCAPQSAHQLSAALTRALGQTPLHLEGGPAIIERIGWCTGAAQGYLEKAAAQGCDAYISGEVSERTAHEAAELGVHYFAAGHHATERGGPKALGQHLADQFGIHVDFIDIPNPV